MAPVVPDRLPAMLFLAALVHGILIIGVTFNAAITDQFADAISLEVTIVADPDQQIDRPDEAAYLAQASQEGGGNITDQIRPSAPLQSAMPVDNQGSEDGTALSDAQAHQRSADEVLATDNPSDRQVAIDPRTEPQPEDSIAVAMEAGSEITLPLPQEDKASFLLTDDDPQQLIISADTRESVAAAYLDSWKRRIEAVGAAYLPELGDNRRPDRQPHAARANRRIRRASRSCRQQMQAAPRCSISHRSTSSSVHRPSMSFPSQWRTNTTLSPSNTSSCSRSNLYAATDGPILSICKRHDSLTNQLLIAMPGMLDPNFSTTVTLICEHNDEGALGIVINRPTTLKLGGLFEQLCR